MNIGDGHNPNLVNINIHTKFGKNPAIHSQKYKNLGCLVWIETFVPRVTVRHHEACQVIPNSDPEGQIFLSTPNHHDRFFFLHTLPVFHCF